MKVKVKNAQTPVMIDLGIGAEVELIRSSEEEKTDEGFKTWAVLEIKRLQQQVELLQSALQKKMKNNE